MSQSGPTLPVGIEECRLRLEHVSPRQPALFGGGAPSEPQALSSDTELNFRPVQYLGSKYRFLSHIASAVEATSPEGSQVCDLFSGSGVVAHRLAERYSVLAVDIQEYSRVLAAALLEPAPLSDKLCRGLGRAATTLATGLMGDLADLINYERTACENVDVRPDVLAEIVEHGSMYVAAERQLSGDGLLDEYLRGALQSLAAGPETVMTRYYGGVFFSYSQAVQIDALATVVRGIDGPEANTAKAALISTASQLAATVGGHFAQPVRPRYRNGRVKEAAVATVARKWQVDAIELYRQWLNRYRKLKRRHGGAALRSDYRDVVTNLPEGVGVVYADPPYTRDHYSRFYHVLETLALGDEPTVSRVRKAGADAISRGLYREDRHQSPFCIKSEVRQAFVDLMEPVASHGAALVLSYSPYGSGSASRPRLMTVKALQELGQSYFSSVEVLGTGPIAHNKLNARHLNSEISYDAEVLLVCRP